MNLTPRSAIIGLITCSVLALLFVGLGSRARRDVRPPVRLGVGALRIEVEGHDPVILEPSTGTWTEHDGEGDLWATCDVGDVTLLCSPSLRLVGWAFMQARKAGGALRIFAACDEVARVLEIFGLKQELGNYASEEEAIRSFEE